MRKRAILILFVLSMLLCTACTDKEKDSEVSAGKTETINQENTSTAEKTTSSDRNTEDVESENTSSESIADTEKKDMEDEVEAFNNFLASKGYMSDLEEVAGESFYNYGEKITKYVIMDFNGDEKNELMIKVSEDSSDDFGFNFIYVYHDGEIKLIRNKYGCYDMRYIPDKNLIVEPFEYRPNGMLFSFHFYKIEGIEYIEQYYVGCDEEYYYGDKDGRTVIESTSPYFEGVKELDWIKID